MIDARGVPWRNCLAVGWLGTEQSLVRGATSEEFKEKLLRFCNAPVHLTRGYHVCPFCHRARGNGQLHVRNTVGGVFVSPALIHHYVEAHNYRPPEKFIEAVMASPERDTRPCPLSDFMYKSGGVTNNEHRIAFFDLLRHSRIGFRVLPSMGTVPPGKYMVGKSGLSIPVATLKDGTPCLAVIADVDELSRYELASTFIQLDAVELARIAIANKAGIIVQASLPNRKAWASISREDVSSILR